MSKPTTHTCLWGDILVGEGAELELCLGPPKSKLWRKCPGEKAGMALRLRGSALLSDEHMLSSTEERPLGGVRIIKDHSFHILKLREGNVC